MSLLSSPIFLPSPSCDLMDHKIPSSVSQLFCTNSIPSPMDVRYIHPLLEGRKTELPTFTKDPEIEPAGIQVQRLEHQRNQVKSVVQELEALMSPVRRMPTDIMTMVFERCIWGPPTQRADPRMAPLLLAQVCRSWRYFVFSLPCLWTTLQLDLPSCTNDWEALVRSRSLSMHAWFSRSKGLPISLSLNHAKGSIVPWHALMHLDKEILTMSCRLKELSLHFSPRSLSCLLTFAQSPLPYLEHLELQNTNSLPTNENLPPITLHSAPRLKSLNLSWYSFDLRGFQIPWAQLQHLNLGYDVSPFWNPVHSDYLQVLACCPNLTTLYLGIGALIKDIDTARVIPVNLPRIHIFKTSIYIPTQYLQRFFDSLLMPKLRHFDIKSVSLTPSSFIGQIECLSFLVRCADTLESVHLNHIDISDTAMLSCLVQLHHLKTLSLLPGVLRLNYGHELFTALALREDELICPVLEVIHLKCSSFIPPDAITRLVASRCQTMPKLKQFSLQLTTFEYGLDTRDDKIKQVQAQLREYVEDGLLLVLTKSSSTG